MLCALGGRLSSFSATLVCMVSESPLGGRVYQRTTSDKWDIPQYNIRNGYIAILYQTIENTMAS